MRLIDADALRERIREEKIASGMAKARLMEMVKEAPTIGGWISVKDRLPDANTEVIVYYTNYEESRIMMMNYYDGRWYDSLYHLSVDDLDHGYITHWMPLPEPPKETNT